MNATREDLIACLYVKGFGKTEALAEALAAPAEAVEVALAELVARGDAEQFRVGARLSASGKAAAEHGLAQERASTDHRRLEQEYERFTPLNAERSTALKESGEGHITEKQDPQEGPECKKKP